MKNYVLLNAIIGDICGSVYEFPKECRKKEIPDKLINDECHFTDDTIHTIAVSTAIMENPENPNFVAHLQDWSRKYPHAGYGSMMSNWINSDDPKPYNSFGNGSAMRVSPCGYMTMNLELACNAATSIIPDILDNSKVSGTFMKYNSGYPSDKNKDGIVLFNNYNIKL